MAVELASIGERLIGIEGGTEDEIAFSLSGLENAGSGMRMGGPSEDGG